MRREIHGADLASESSLLDKETQDSSAITTTTTLLFTTFVAVSGSFVFGSAIGYSSPVQSDLTNDLNLSVAEYSLFGSILTIGAMIGAAMSGRIADLTMGFSEMFCILGWLTIYLSKVAVWLDVGRFLVGYGMGVLSFVVPVYIAEISPKDLRGSFTTVHQVNTYYKITKLYLQNIFIHKSIRLTKYYHISIVLNKRTTAAFAPKRGLRQGDPLSPYLFVLCMERLCHLIEVAVAGKRWKPIKLSRGGPQLSHVCFADDLILFAEASVAQIRVIRRILEEFCVASGQKVSLEKSKIYFSENVSREMGRLISDESGIGATRDLGKYLGMPVLQKRINKDTFAEVLEKVSSRLAGWKGRMMSLAGRITLTKSVLSSIPVHTMSTIMLPQSTLARLDKISRSFVWGDSEEQRRQHLVSWSKICLPKGEGGLGIRKSQDMNKALVSKLGWRLLNDDTSLWARVLRSKYKVTDIRDGSWFKRTGNWSPIWRSVLKGMREVVIPGVSWVAGDGRNIRFWKDKWLTQTPLLEEVRTMVPEDLAEVTMSELWQRGVGWVLSLIEPYITEYTKLQLSAVVLDDITGAKDRVSWGYSLNGAFSVKSAYAFLTRDDTPRLNMRALFTCIWHVLAPERTRVFLWLVANGAIMTNMERRRRHLSDTGVCQVCQGGEESILHVLRDCPAMSGIWNRIVPTRKQRDFFSLPLAQWLYENLSSETDMGDYSWPTIFAMAAWWGWKWRCWSVFGKTGLCRDRMRFLKELAKEVTSAHAKVRTAVRVGARIERNIAWTPPAQGWWKMNTDGASRGNPGRATAGGALRDEHGLWICGFALNIGICSAPLAELWGIYYGLYMAWERRVSRLIVEVDSEMVVGFFDKGISDSHPLSFLVRLCYGFFSRDWLVRVTHVYREANRVADGLANYAFDLSLGFHSFTSPPVEISTLMMEDVDGSTRVRFVRT